MKLQWVSPQASGEVELKEGVTLGEALQLINLPAAAYAWGVWGKKQPESYVLQAADRIEAYAALIASPMDTRRRRSAMNPVTRQAKMLASKRIIQKDI